ncbi:MAG: hypothetical protein KBC84_04190 [Proteobacteria bacterium]|nr:hypothetical protein [Pseudomonadota bacterium]
MSKANIYLTLLFLFSCSLPPEALPKKNRNYEATKLKTEVDEVKEKKAKQEEINNKLTLENDRLKSENAKLLKQLETYKTALAKKNAKPKRKIISVVSAPVETKAAEVTTTIATTTTTTLKPEDVEYSPSDAPIKK